MNRIHKIKFEGQTEEFVINDANQEAENAFAYGDNVQALAPASSAFGVGTEASNEGAHVVGKYNLIDNEDKYLYIVGNGTNTVRSNAHTVDKEGNGWFAGDVSGQVNGENISFESLKTLYDTLNAYIKDIEKNFSEIIVENMGIKCEDNNGIINFTITSNIKGEE